MNNSDTFFALDQSDPTENWGDGGNESLDDETFGVGIGELSNSWEGEQYSHASMIEQEKMKFKQQENNPLTPPNQPLPDFFSSFSSPPQSQSQPTALPSFFSPQGSYENTPTINPNEFHAFHSMDQNLSWLPTPRNPPVQAQTPSFPFSGTSMDRTAPVQIEMELKTVPVLSKSPKSSVIRDIHGNITITSNKGSRRAPTNLPPPRRIWTQPSGKMTAAEIDNILRIQDLQLQSIHPYIEDYYFQNHLNKAAASHQIPTFNHVPLYEAMGSSSFYKQGFQLAGVLGQIPSRKGNAPRPLLNLRDELKLERKQHASVLLLIENCFDKILDIEDIDKLIRFSTPSQAEVMKLTNKRTEIIQHLFDLVPLFILDANKDQPRFFDDAICSWEEDQPLLKFLNTKKGRTLLVRLLPLLPPYYAHGFFFFLMRNFCLILGIIEQSPSEMSERIIPTLATQLSGMNIPQIQVCLQVFAHFHNDEFIVSVLQTKRGLDLLRAMFYSVSAQLSRNPPPQMMQQYMNARQQWSSTVDMFFRRFIGKFVILFDTQDENKTEFYVSLLQFLCSWVQHLSPTHHKVILLEIPEKITFISQNFPDLLPLAHELVTFLTRSE